MRKKETKKHADKSTTKAISYQNKDIISKFFGDRMKGKSLSLFELDLNLKVVDVRPTNIPIVEVREFRMDTKKGRFVRNNCRDFRISDRCY